MRLDEEFTIIITSHPRTAPLGEGGVSIRPDPRDIGRLYFCLDARIPLDLWSLKSAFELLVGELRTLASHSCIRQSLEKLSRALRIACLLEQRGSQL